MNTVYVPSTGVEDWRTRLADPIKHWKPGYSARALAYSWSEAGNRFPASVDAVLRSSPMFRDIEVLFSIPEHQVSLPPLNGHPSQNDLWVIARTAGELISIAVEGKVREPFGPRVGEWQSDETPGRRARLAFLVGLLELKGCQLDNIAYQLLHRTASAIIEAKRFAANNAMMLVHSFSQEGAHFEDYQNFVSLFDRMPTAHDTVCSVGERSGVSLHFAWVTGDPKYLAR